ncbi:hypothetical protein F5B21DRAFT_31899 [Xylaria acuta]|nr:hypothetical protein F5B21DRAFT_31899 [Xylaria acuta]
MRNQSRLRTLYLEGLRCARPLVYHYVSQGYLLLLLLLLLLSLPLLFPESGAGLLVVVVSILAASILPPPLTTLALFDCYAELTGSRRSDDA